MKKLVSIFVLFTIFAMYLNIAAQSEQPTPPKEHGKNFVDKNGDGYNDNAPDHDGDGIPNGVDPDYTGPKYQKGKFVDLNGDGINDNAVRGKGKHGNKATMKGFGPSNGTGNNGVGPKDGTGNGPGTCNPTGTGTQNGNGRGYKGGKK